MVEVCVVLVEPKHQCNVGFVARAMKNFGFKRLYFSGKGFVPGQKAFECAAHAKDVLEDSKDLGEKPLNEVFDFVIGTTAKTLQKESSPRVAITPKEMTEKLREIDGEAALLFGREDVGLLNEELDSCDMVVSIPAGSEYSTLNLSHAAAIIFYEIALAQEPPASEVREVSGVEKEALLKRVATLLDTLEYPNYKKRVAERIFRKVIGRAGISGREAHTLAGIFKEADDEIKRRKRID
ncbi:MAG: TrmJ/YjtD family RNA methyltransferase [Candidatus Hydrothermarchaeales archaeon]